jgi:hypothetical protein
MTAAGTVYEDKDGMKAEMIRIFKVAPKSVAKDTAKEAKPDSLVADSVKKEESLKE